MAGSFVSSRYEANDNLVYEIRVQQETIDAVIAGASNAPPSGAVDQAVSAYATNSRRRIGVNARQVTLEFTAAIPAGYSGDNVRIPCLTPDTFTTWTRPRRRTGTYLGVPVRVVGSSAESVR